ncbi:hypothetical protein CYMTET_24007 [Cymbomonas tetramitiformis]|uniref:Dynein heavy chain coiled coil stalk domain-containing protein n=1 Tax=Cymbomonas tetramitiformis TaxID=36881 RepID=A0AAE0FWQ5_9CHLO|nr:hypothetical protein CYMTET_24007 [Cymbomonas tetramitiformis]
MELHTHEYNAGLGALTPTATEQFQALSSINSRLAELLQLDDENHKNLKSILELRRAAFVTCDRRIARVALTAADTALSYITPDSLAQLSFQAYSRPSSLTVRSAVLVLLGHTTRCAEAKKKGWSYAVQQLRQEDFLEQLRAATLRVTSEGLPSSTWKSLNSTLLTLEGIDFASERASCLATSQLYAWARNMVTYHAWAPASIQNPESAPATSSNIEQLLTEGEAYSVELSRTLSSLEALMRERHVELEKTKATLEPMKSSLYCLTKEKTVEMKAMANPPTAVKEVMQAICILFGVKPVRRREHSAGYARYVSDYWPSSVQLLADPHFMLKLAAFDVHSLTPRRLKQLRRYLADSALHPEAVKSVSIAAWELCVWVTAVAAYAEPLHTATRIAMGVKSAEEAQHRAVQVVAGFQQLSRVHRERAACKTEVDFGDEESWEILDLPLPPSPSGGWEMMALVSLDCVAPKKLAEIRAIRFPPTLVLVTFQAVCSVLRTKCDTWKDCREILKDVNGFLGRLREVDPSDIDLTLLTKLHRFMQLEGFSAETLRRASEAASHLCQWVTAMYQQRRAAVRVSALPSCGLEVEGGAVWAGVPLPSLTKPEEKCGEGMSPASQGPMHFLDRKDLSELAALPHPPAGAKAVVSAALLLLGQTDMSWARGQRLLRAGFLRRLGELELACRLRMKKGGGLRTGMNEPPGAADFSAALARVTSARALVEKHPPCDVRRISAAAAGLAFWAHAVLADADLAHEMTCAGAEKFPVGHREVGFSPADTAAASGQEARAKIPRAAPSDGADIQLDSRLSAALAEGVPERVARAAFERLRRTSTKEELQGLQSMWQSWTAERLRWQKAKADPGGVNSLPFPKEDNCFARTTAEWQLVQHYNCLLCPGGPRKFMAKEWGIESRCKVTPYDANQRPFKLRCFEVQYLEAGQLVEVEVAIRPSELRPGVHIGKPFYDGIVPGVCAWRLLGNVLGEVGDCVEQRWVASLRGSTDLSEFYDGVCSEAGVWQPLPADVIKDDVLNTAQVALLAARKRRGGFTGNCREFWQSGQRVPVPAIQRRLQRMQKYFQAYDLKRVVPQVSDEFFQECVRVLKPSDVANITARHRMQEVAQWERWAEEGAKLTCFAADGKWPPPTWHIVAQRKAMAARRKAAVTASAHQKTKRDRTSLLQKDAFGDVKGGQAVDRLPMQSSDKFGSWNCALA